MILYNATVRAAMAKAVLETSDNPGEALAIVQVLSDPRPLRLEGVVSDLDGVRFTLAADKPPRMNTPPAHTLPKPWEYVPCPVKAEPTPDATPSTAEQQGVAPEPEYSVNSVKQAAARAFEEYGERQRKKAKAEQLEQAKADLEKEQAEADAARPPETEADAKAQARAFMKDHEPIMRALAGDDASTQASKPTSSQRQPCAFPECERRVEGGGYCCDRCRYEHDKLLEATTRMNDIDPKVRALELFQKVYGDLNRAAAVARYGTAAVRFWDDCLLSARQELREPEQEPEPEQPGPTAKACARPECSVSHTKAGDYCSQSCAQKHTWAKRKGDV